MDRKMDVEALGQYVYGKSWRESAVEQGQLDILLEFAAAKQLREVVKELEKAMREDTAESDTISVTVGKKWSKETDRAVKSRGAEMLRGFLDNTALSSATRTKNNVRVSDRFWHGHDPVTVRLRIGQGAPRTVSPA